jgi:ankyrin repeat protein
MNRCKISLLLGAFLMPVVSYGSADFTGAAGQFAGVVVSDEALFSAIRAGNFDLVNYLIDHGVNVNSREEEVECHWGYSFTHYLSPLVVAIRTGNIDMVRLLLQRGANVNTQGGKHNVPLYEAVNYSYGQPNIILLLLKQDGINVNVPQDIGMSYDEYENNSLGYDKDSDYQVPKTTLKRIGNTPTEEWKEIVRLLREKGARTR